MYARCVWCVWGVWTYVVCMREVCEVCVGYVCGLCLCVRGVIVIVFSLCVGGVCVRCGVCI